MSQTTVSSAFQAVPENPNLRAAARNADAPTTAAPAAASSLGNAGTATPHLAPQQPALSAGAPLLPPAREPNPVAPQQPAQPQTPPPVVTQPTPAPAAPQQPAFQPDWAAIMAAQQRQNELERANAAMQQKLQEQDATISNLMQLQQEHADLQRQMQLRKDADSIDYSQLNTVDPEDAKRISEGVLKAMEARLAPMQQQMQQQQQQLQQTAQYQEQRFVQQRAQNTVAKIMEKHPDFLALQQNPNFRAFMQQRDGYSSQTLDDRAAAEFKMGNAQYITHLIDQFKRVSQPAAESITSVAPVQTAAAPAAPAGPAEQLPTLHELNSMYQMRQISPDQYREWLAKIRAAQNYQG